MSLNFSNQSRKVAIQKGHGTVRKDVESRGISAGEHCNKVLFQGHRLAYHTKVKIRHHICSRVATGSMVPSVHYALCTMHY